MLYMRHFFYLLFILLLVSCKGHKGAINLNETEEERDSFIVRSREVQNSDDINEDEESSSTYSSDNSHSGERESYRKFYYDGNGELIYIAYSPEDAEHYEASRMSSSNVQNVQYEDRNSGTIDYHDWNKTDIEGFYIELDNCRSSEEAEEISNEYYEGDYIEDFGRYFAKTSVQSRNGVDIELGERINSKFFHVRGSKLFVLFKWYEGYSRSDKGKADIWNSKGVFYKMP